MIEQQILARLEILFAQHRFDDAEKLLLGFLEQYPTNDYAQYMLAVVYFNQNKLELCRNLIDPLIAENPEETEYLGLSVRLDISQELFASADEKCEMLISQDPENPEFYNLLATSKFRQRKYDKALFFAQKALETDPENLVALNLKSTLSGILGKEEDAFLSINEALQQDPNNDWTIANHGRQLLNQGKVQEALERFKEALSINPNNALAQYGLTEALKSRFWPYKMFYKYQMLMSRLNSNQIWGIMIVAFILMRFLQTTADNNPDLAIFLMPLIYIIVAVFLSTWLMTPLMNLYLLTNKYGRLLLDDDDKKSAKYVGYSLSAAVFFAILLVITKAKGLDLAALFFIALMIPLGSMYNPPKAKDKDRMFMITMGILGVGILGLVVNFIFDYNMIVIIAFGGIFIYQWLINAVMIKSGAKVNE